jgi:hypothetical protein
VDFHKKSDSIFQDFIELLLDLPFILFSILSFWRIYFIFKFLLQKENRLDYPSIGEIRRYSWRQFCLFLSDLPILLFFFLLLVSIYRFIPLVRKLKKEELDNYNYFIMIEFIGLLSDIPYFLISILSCWRIYFILKHLREEFTEESLRKEVVNQFQYFLLDIPCIFIFLWIVLSMYRLWNLITKWRVSPVCSSKTQNEWKHEVFFHEFMESITDIPYIILGILSIWRIPILSFKVFQKNQKNEYPSSVERRRDSLTQFKLFLLDIPCIFIFIILLLSLYRFWNLITTWRVSVVFRSLPIGGMETSSIL